MPTHIENIENIENANFYGDTEKPPLSFNISEPKGFIGREVELKELQTTKDSGRTAFVLHGAGGVGKTDLALEFIKRNKSAYQAAVRVDMQGLSEKPLPPIDAMLEVIRAFDPTVAADLSDADVKNLYESKLNAQSTILFFDNAKDREQVESLNNSAALIIVTSRETFHISGGFSTKIEQMSPADARDLLYSIADEQRFDGQANALAFLAGYLPMALLPLAALLAEDVTLEIRDLIQKYSDRKEALLLKDPNRENLSVEASFDLSYETLTVEQKERWRKLAVFPADFDLEAMQAVWQIEDGKATRSELVKKHLLEFNQETKRSRLHDLVRVYLNGKIPTNETFIIKFAFSLNYGRILASLQNPTVSNLKEFDLEQTNIESGFAWLVNRVEQDEISAQLCMMYISNSHSILSIRLHSRNYIKWLEAGLKAAKTLNNQQLTCICLSNLGNTYRKLGQFQKAITYSKKALEIAKELGDCHIEADNLCNLGTTFGHLGKYEKAIIYHEQVLDIAKKFENRRNESASLGNLGVIYLSLGDYQKAAEYQEQALSISKEFGDLQGIGASYMNLGNALFKLGDYKKAII